MKRVEAGRQLAHGVSHDLFAAEAAIDEAMMQIAGLAQRLPPASRAAGFASTRGQDVYEALGHAMAAQIQARAAMVTVHTRLSDLKESSHLRSVAIGGGTKDPERPPSPTTALADQVIVG
ncbi:MAG: hypothetical protein ACI8U3_001505 [Brevundimonas sp.]|jgi:hypothetical protein